MFGGKGMIIVLIFIIQATSITKLKMKLQQNTLINYKGEQKNGK